MDDFKIVQAQPSILYASIGAGDMTMTVQGLYDLYGNTLTMTDFGEIAYATLEPRNYDNQEIVSFTAVADNGDGTFTLTLDDRGLAGKSPYGATGTARPHSARVEVVISNNPQFYDQLVNTKNNQTIDGIKIFNDTPQSPTPAALNNDIPNYAQLLAAVFGGITTANVVIPGTAGETLIAGQVVYFKESDARWYKADADLVATFGAVLLGIVQGAATAGVAITVIRPGGIDSNQAALVAGTKYYLSSTAGGISATPASNVVFIGIAATTTKLLFAPGAFSEFFTFGTAGETLSVGDTVYFKESDQKWWKTDADAAATAFNVQIGIVQLAAASANDATIVRTGGTDQTKTGLTAGLRYYLSATAGALSTTPGLYQRLVGIALSTTELMLVNSGSTATPNNYTVTADETVVDYFTYPLPLIYSNNDGGNDFLCGWEKTNMAARAPGDPGLGGGGYTRLVAGAANSVVTAELPGSGTSSTYTAADLKIIRLKYRAAFDSLGVGEVEAHGLVNAAAGAYGTEDSTLRGVRFVYNNTTLYAVTADGAARTKTTITGVTPTSYVTYEIVFTPAGSALFYVNGILKATHTTNLPATGLLAAYGILDNANFIDTTPIIVSIQN